MPTRFGGMNAAYAVAASAARMATWNKYLAVGATADVISAPATSKAVKVLGGMISVPPSFVFFHDLISLSGRKCNLPVVGDGRSDSNLRLWAASRGLALSCGRDFRESRRKLPPNVGGFRSGRDFAAWLGSVPAPRSAIKQSAGRGHLTMMRVAFHSAMTRTLGWLGVAENAEQRLGRANLTPRKCRGFSHTGK